MDKKYYTVKEVADLLEVSATTVRRWADNHEIEAFKIKGIYRIKKEPIDKLVGGEIA